jgi:phosphoribosylanthranilate isomerase
MVRVKICCIRSQREADLAKRYGAHALGLVSSMPSGEHAISDQQIRELAGANADVKRFLLTCRTKPDEIRRQALDAETDTLQLVDYIDLADLERLRIDLPGVSLVQVVHVTGPSAISQARDVEPYVDAILLDSGTPDGPARTLGGTGNTHDWAISAQIVSHVDCPVFLAGGLGPGNVAEAIDRVRPYGVDVCSRLRPHGHLDEDLLAQFFDAVGDAPAV